MPTMTSMEPSNTGTREWRFSRSAGRISARGVSTSRQNMSVRGTMTERTSVSSSSKTCWTTSRSSRSTTPSLAPTSTSVRSSSSLSAACVSAPRPSRRTVSVVKPASTPRIGASSHSSHRTGRSTTARKRSGYFTASVIGSTSPKVVSRTTIAISSTSRPQRGPNSVCAVCVASAEAPMLMSVMPTSSVTSRSCGRDTTGARAPSGRWAAIRRSRARPSEKYAASAPESRPEATMRAPSSNSCRTRLSPTEVLEARRHRHGAPAAVEPPRAGARHDLADRGERGAGGVGEAVAQTREQDRVADDQQLVVLAAARRPVDRVHVERVGDGARGGGDRQALDVDVRADAALGHQPAEIGRETVREVHHRRHAAGIREPASLVHTRAGPQMRARDVVEQRRVHAAWRGLALQDGEPGGSASQRVGHGDHVAGAGGGTQHGTDGLAEQGHAHQPSGGRCRGVAAYDGDAVFVGHGDRALVERLDLVGFGAVGTAEADERPAGEAAHGRDVRDVHGKGFRADVCRLGPAAPKMDVLDEQISGDEQRGAAAVPLEDRAVVADAGQQTGRTPAHELADQPDEVVLARFIAGHGATAVLPRKLPSSRFPSTVRMDSGWNCTPSTGQWRCRTPMLSPSSAHAVTSSVSGTVWGRITSEWSRVAVKGFDRPAK